MAEELAAEGARVAICSRDAKRIDAAAKQIAERTGAQVLGIVADVTRAEDVERFVKTAVERWG
ncbi:MAG: SDR family NAD(P)-dependent oxidoreductase, partial [Acidobacteria bacterium]|nr:SDR family NAD(P)-dependent oxidoreductase [Acidobacteriota bacterium]